jgi:hypothetical protein
MPTSRKPGPLGRSRRRSALRPARTPGPLGVNDRGDPNVLSHVGDTPMSTGTGKQSPPQIYRRPDPVTHVDTSAARKQGSARGQTVLKPGGRAGGAEAGTGADEYQPLESGSAFVVGGSVGSVARIPVPGTNGLFLELKPRGWTPAGGSTSTVFIQDAAGSRNLRLDYGFNKSSGVVDYHWNQSKTFKLFGIADHTTVGQAGRLLYRGARYYRYAGRALLLVGAAIDIYSIVVARKRLRQVARVAAGWAGAWAGCTVLGSEGAVAGSAEPGLGTAIGGFAGCFVGGIGGYVGASWAAGEAYDWVEETYFAPVPEAKDADK